MNGLIRPELLVITDAQLHALAPYFAVFGGIVLLMMAAVLKFMSPKWPVFALSLVVACVGACMCIERMGEAPTLLFNGMMVVDSFGHAFNLVFIGTAAFTTLVSLRYLDRERLQYPEYYVLLWVSALGMMLMAAATDLIVFFIALETMSLAVYSLVGFRRADRRSNEAALKYFILGAAASAVLLYGTALLYGATGTTDIRQIFGLISTRPDLMTPIFVLGAWLVVSGFLFKVASVPFHMWMPDVYEGAPAPITGFMTTGVKAASFAAFVRVLSSLGYGRALAESVDAHFHDILWVCAVLTMVIGNITALTQTNLKRMLAYSSIAHTGYLMVGLIGASKSGEGYAPVLMYLVGYSVMNLGAFAVLTALSSQSDGGLNLHDLSGVSRRHPWLAFAMAVFLFSMAGIPPTAGFAAKYLLFYSAVQSGELILVILSVLCSAISVYYYLRVLVYLYMRDPVGSPAERRVSRALGLAVAAMALLTLQIGVTPSRWVDAAKRAVSSL